MPMKTKWTHYKTHDPSSWEPESNAMSKVWSWERESMRHYLEEKDVDSGIWSAVRVRW